MNPILECQGLSKQFGNVQALSNLNFSLERGQIVGLLGPNGSGKTTLIKIINGLLIPDTGSVTINKEAPSPKTKLLISYLPDKNCLNEQMDLSELINFFADFYDDFSTERAYAMLEDLDIDSYSYLKDLPKETQEKVQLILVMSRNADLYILDEPISGVDPATHDYILSTIIQNYNPEATVLLSTPFVSNIENVLDRVLFLQNGALVLNSTVDEIRLQQQKSVDSLFQEVFKC